MFDEPEEAKSEQAGSPAERAREKSDEFRMHAELAAVFEWVRKTDAEIRPNLSADLARDIQRSMGKLEKSKSPQHPVLPAESTPEAARLLNLPETESLTTNDYHVYRRPGEVMIARWLGGDEVEGFYARLQAHFDAALEGHKEDERQANEWKQTPGTMVYLNELDKLEVKLSERYLRKEIQQHKIFVLSTQSADEMNIAYLSDYIMNVSPAELVGPASAPPDEPSEQDLAWFFKLFSLRGIRDGVEQMCFFAYLQKSDDSF
jgi:hypothetical protein